jgi:hypothetical protein
MADDTIKKVYVISMLPFALEDQGKYDDALSTHKKAADVLQTAVDLFKKTSKVSKFHRKMFERQVAIHRERSAYLQTLQAKGTYDGIVPVPTSTTANKDLQLEDGKSRPLSLVGSQIGSAPI